MSFSEPLAERGKQPNLAPNVGRRKALPLNKSSVGVEMLGQRPGPDAYDVVYRNEGFIIHP